MLLGICRPSPAHVHFVDSLLTEQMPLCVGHLVGRVDPGVLMLPASGTVWLPTLVTLIRQTAVTAPRCSEWTDALFVASTVAFASPHWGWGLSCFLSCWRSQQDDRHPAQHICCPVQNTSLCAEGYLVSAVSTRTCVVICRIFAGVQQGVCCLLVCDRTSVVLCNGLT